MTGFLILKCCPGCGGDGGVPSPCDKHACTGPCETAPANITLKLPDCIVKRCLCTTYTGPGASGCIDCPDPPPPYPDFFITLTQDPTRPCSRMDLNPLWSGQARLFCTEPLGPTPDCTVTFTLQYVRDSADYPDCWILCMTGSGLSGPISMCFLGVAVGGFDESGTLTVTCCPDATFAGDCLNCFDVAVDPDNPCGSTACNSPCDDAFASTLSLVVPDCVAHRCTGTTVGPTINSWTIDSHCDTGYGVATFNSAVFTVDGCDFYASAQLDGFGCWNIFIFVDDGSGPIGFQFKARKILGASIDGLEFVCCGGDVGCGGCTALTASL